MYGFEVYDTSQTWPRVSAQTPTWKLISKLTVTTSAQSEIYLKPSRYYSNTWYCGAFLASQSIPSITPTSVIALQVSSVGVCYWVDFINKILWVITDTPGTVSFRLYATVGDPPKNGKWGLEVPGVFDSRFNHLHLSEVYNQDTLISSQSYTPMQLTGVSLGDWVFVPQARYTGFNYYRYRNWPIIREYAYGNFQVLLVKSVGGGGTISRVTKTFFFGDTSKPTLNNRYVPFQVHKVINPGVF